MPLRSTRISRKSGRRILVGAVVASLATIAITAGPALAKPANPAKAAKPSGPSAAGAANISDKAKFYDSRKDPAVQKVLQNRAANLAARPKAGVTSLRNELGIEGVISIDPLTSTARSVARLDGFLTVPSSKSAPTIALAYVRSHPDVFGLDATAISRLSLRRDYVDIAGTHHLSYIQTVAGIPVFGNGLQANVARNGQLINVLGSPVASLPTAAAAPGISATAARNAAVKDISSSVKAAAATAPSGARQMTDFSNGDNAALAYFMTAGGLRLGWQTLTTPTNKELYLHVIDAATGRVLYRQSLTDSDSAKVWEYFPGAPKGGQAATQNLSSKGWLPYGAPDLNGNVAHVYSDVNDDNTAEPTEEILPSGTKAFNYPLVNFNSLGAPCSAQFVCTWDPATPNSWQTNRAQNSVQVFYYLGKFHDHLAAAPIGFTSAAGNFEAKDGDQLQAETMDGADTMSGLPDPNHTDNANMSTPPDGQSPRMQMYLFPDPSTLGDPFLASNGGDEADIVFHEYTHGLSNRLVVDAMGNSTLGNIQAGSMGEAWSDWYAMDFLVNEGFQKDAKAPGDVRIGQYVGVGQDLIRTQPLDCPVGTTSLLCPGGADTPAGGYTYGDFGKIIGQPEVHADGEIWSETLWDLRDALGSKLSESLITRAMELSPSNPSYLDERNAILMADQVVNHGQANKTIWNVFAHRGMGYFAGAIDGDDTSPVEDFSLPPKAGTPTGSLSGTVTDQDSGTAIAGAVVGFGGHASGFPNDYAAVTDASGDYTITGILPGTYPSVFSKADGFDRVTGTVSVSHGANSRDWTMRRDWAALGGGGSVTDFTGPDFTDFGCGPSSAIDQSLGLGWGSTVDPVGTSATPKYVTVKLPQAINIAEIAIDPGNTCGDGGSASTGDYAVETSTDGITFTPASAGTFTVANRHVLNAVTLSAGSTTGVQYVRFIMKGTQVPGGLGSCPGAFSGCDFMDMSELEVYGTPAS
jgi:extracellular elastinolytic metalloproteinase